MGEANKKASVGVIGLGNMGSAIAERLIVSGHHVTVWNRTPSKAAPLKALGAAVASSPADLVEAADLVIANLTDHAATLAVLESEDTAAALRGKTLVQTAMTTSSEAESLAAWAAANGCGFLGAFIFSYPVSVLEGAGNLVYAGPRHLFDAQLDIFKAFDDEPRFLSTDVGAAAAFGAAVISSFCGCIMAFFHGAAMSDKRGIPIELFTEYAANNAFGSMNALGQMLCESADDVQVNATLPIYAAALDVVIREAGALGVDNAFHALLKTHLAKGIADGHGEHDIDAIRPQFFKDTA